ncbi:MAG: thiamine phosphate synthase [Lysobacterales bacterium]
MTGLGRGGLYLITDGGPDLLSRVEAALQGGVGALQYRDKSGDSDRRLTEAQALGQLCRRFQIPFIVNDDIELALAVDADGVHLGLLDTGIARARQVLGPERIIGASCYNSLVNAQRAVEADADYIAFGAFFPSRTKPDAVPASMGLLRKAGVFQRRIVAIGGITADNAGPLLAAGADWLAVCADVLGADDPGLAAARYRPLFQPRLH